jgi:UDP-glucose 4-epimerase
MSRIAVTGGAGYIGSVVVEELLSRGNSVVVLDNLSKGHAEAVPADVPLIEVNLLDTEKVRRALSEHSVTSVVHMAADSLVAESVCDPARYYLNNLQGTLSLLNAMRASGVHRIVFSSTAAVYGEPKIQPITETSPTQPTNPYGETKLAVERALHWYESAYGLKFAALRYFNAAGATLNSGEAHDPESHLIPIVLQAAAGLRDFVHVYGDDYPTADGTCIRDYIHVSDLAAAHVLALDFLAERSAIWNLGCGGHGYSVRQVIDTAQEITGRKIPVRISPRRAGDPAILVASSDKIRRELGWVPERAALADIIDSAWRWMHRHPSGYGARAA